MAAVFVFFVVPELNQRSLEQIDELFEQKVPTRQFPSYVCRGPETKSTVLGSEEKEATVQEIAV